LEKAIFLKRTLLESQSEVKKGEADSD
jgi:hypothetical protein